MLFQDESLETDLTATTQPAGDFTPSRDLRSGVDQLSETGGQLIESLPIIAVGIAIFAGFVLASHLLKWVVRRFSKRGRQWDQWGLVVAVSRLTQGLMILLGLLVAAVIVFPGFTPTKLLQFLGFGSVAIGFAFRDVLQNYLAGLLLLFTRPFRIGDEITFGDHEGIVQDIQTRATFIRTYDGRRVVIPNGELFTNSVLVNTAYEQRRVEYDIGIGYGDDIGEAKAILLDVMQQDPTANDEPPPKVFVIELGGEAVMLRCRWWIDPPQKRDLFESRDNMLTQAKQRLTAAGIDLPFPTQQVLFHDQTERDDGDRRSQREGWPSKDDADDTRRRPPSRSSPSPEASKDAPRSAR